MKCEPADEKTVSVGVKRTDEIIVLYFMAVVTNVPVSGGEQTGSKKRPAERKKNELHPKN